MNIAIASDHGGYRLKQDIMRALAKDNIEYQDFGTLSEASVDYPDYAKAVAEAVAGGDFSQGILCCGTGIGMAIAANKVPGIRAAVCGDTFSARACKEHNNANIITLGQRVTGPGLAIDIVKTWLQAEYQGGRHQQRLDKIEAIEQSHKG